MAPIAGRALAVGLLLAFILSARSRFLYRQDPSFDRFTNSEDFLKQPWLNTHFDRMMVYSPYFDSKLPFYTRALAYIDAYGVAPTSDLVGAHPDWLLADRDGLNRRYVPYECSEGSCPQYAADIGNPEFRRYWIESARSTLKQGYAGLWIDDVNLQFRVSDGEGHLSPPYDRRRGSLMSEDQWRSYMATFVEEIRAAFPDVELIHNSIWFAGPAKVRDNDADVVRQIAAADFINIERGINDSGLTGGYGPWSLRALLSFVDRVHTRNRHVVIDDFSKSESERLYALAGYYLIADSRDMIGNQSMNPNNWWLGYDVDLGLSLGGRKEWNGLFRRDFTGGFVLLNGPGEPTRTVLLPEGFADWAGKPVSQVTLSTKQAFIAMKNPRYRSETVSSRQ